MQIEHGPGKDEQLLPKKKERGRKLMDQKANSIADMAAVLALQARAPTEKEVDRAKFFVRTDGRPVAKRGKGSQRTNDVIEFQGRIGGTSVWWVDLLDAEFAETWPVQVVHGRLAVNRGTAVWPPPEELVVKEVELGSGEKVVAEEPAWEKARVEEEMEGRRKLLRRSAEVSAKEKFAEAERMVVEAREMEKEKGDGGKGGSWFESTRRLFPGFAGRKVETPEAAVPAPSA